MIERSRDVSRRSFLKISAGLVALADSAKGWSASDFGLSSGPGWVALLHQGNEVFRLRSDAFGGKSSLWKHEAEGQLAFGIEDARHGGLLLPADLTCELWEGSLGVHASVHHTGLDVSFKGFAHEWLLGEGLWANLRKEIPILDSDGAELVVGPGPVLFTRDGHVSFHGATRARLHRSGIQVSGSFAQLRNAVSNADDVHACGSSLCIHRGDAVWPVTPPCGRWTYTNANSIFTALSVHAEESQTGCRTYRAAFTGDENSNFDVIPRMPLRGTNGESLHLKMWHPVYSLDLSDGGGVMEASLAKPHLLAMGPLRLSLRQPAVGPALHSDGTSSWMMAQAELEGVLDEAFVFRKENHPEDDWHVRLLDDDPSPDYSGATLDMIGDSPVLSGDIRFRIVRPIDFLDIGFRTSNVSLFFSSPSLPRLRAINPEIASLLVAEFQTLALLEPVTDDSDPDGGDGCTPKTSQANGTMLSRAATPSRVSLELFEDEPQPPLSLEALLRWSKYPLNIDPRAKSLRTAEDKATTGDIPPFSTEIIAPAGLGLSPDETQAFFSSEKVRQDGGVTQTWTARLAKRIPPASNTSGKAGYSHFPVTADRRPAVRPIIAKTLPNADNITDAFAFTNDDTEAIVRELADSSATTRHLVISPAGAWLDMRAAWPLDAKSNSTSFSARIAAGSEQDEEMVYEAVLIPAGHRVSVVKSSKRQWCRNGSQLLVAGLIRRFKIVYPENPTQSYMGLRGDPAAVSGVQLPFDSITLVGKETPFLYVRDAKNFANDCHAATPAIDNYWATLQDPGTQTLFPFEFPVIATDRAGVGHRTTMRMIVACANHIYDPQYCDRVIAAYNAHKGADPTIQLSQQRVAYAKPLKMGQTSYPTGRMSLQAIKVKDLASASAAKGLPCYPQMMNVDLTLEHVSAFSNADKTSGITFQYASVYKSEPFDDLKYTPKANRTEVILQLTNTPNPVQFPFNGKLGGGLALPSTGVVALGRRAGTVFRNVDSDLHDLETFLTDVGNGGFRIAEVFKSASMAASLLGAVNLSDVLEEVSDSIAQASNVPLLASHQLQTLEADVVQKAKSALQPILDLQTKAFTFVSKLQAEITQAVGAVRQAVQLASALVRVVASEQRPKDVEALIGVLVDGQGHDLVVPLKAKLAQAQLTRVRNATQLPLDENPPCLPTLYQLRDYALHPVLQQTEDKVNQLIKQLDEQLANDQATLQSELDQACAVAGKLVGDLAETIIFKLLAAVDGLNSAIANGQLDAVSEAIESVCQVSASLKTASQSWQNLKKSLQDELTRHNTSWSQASLSARVTRVKQALDNAGSALPQPVLQKTKDALDQIATQPQIQKVIKGIDDANKKVTDLITSYEAALKEFQNDFDSVEDKVLSAIDEVRELLTIPRHIAVSYSYQTKLHNFGPFLASRGANQSKFSLNSSVQLNLDGTPPSFNIKAEVTDFRLLLLPSAPFIIIGFPRATMTSENGQSPKVSCPFSEKDIEFVGPLNFVADLAKTLHLPDELIVQLTGLGLIIGYNAALPSFACGAFNMTGLSIYTAVKLDFTGAPLRMIFGFANPNQHFLMTYLFLGGGGFVNLEFTPGGHSDGMTVTAALEFGAMAALDFGVAHGDVHIFAGFYMSLHSDDFLLSGYLRAGGEFDVLGLISASIEFLVSLSYEDRGGNAWLSGDCEVDIDVHVLFFSASVSLHMHHEFSGHSGS